MLLLLSNAERWKAMLGLILMWNNTNTMQHWCCYSKKGNIWVKDIRRRRRRVILAPRAAPPQAAGSQKWKCHRAYLVRFDNSLFRYCDLISFQKFSKPLTYVLYNDILSPFIEFQKVRCKRRKLLWILSNHVFVVQYFLFNVSVKVLKENKLLKVMSRSS